MGGVIKMRPQAQLAKDIYLKNPKIPRWSKPEMKKTPDLYGRVLFEHLKGQIAQKQQPAKIWGSLIRIFKEAGVQQETIKKIEKGVIEQAGVYGMDLSKSLKIAKRSKK